MGRSNNRFLSVLAVLVASIGFGAFAPRVGAAPHGAGSLDPSFGEGGRVFASSVAEASPGDFGAAAREPNGDLVVESRYRGIAEEPVREIQLRTPGGALVPSFGEGGRVAIEGEEGTGVAVLSDGDIVIGTTFCGGARSVAEMLEPDGAKAAGFGSDGCGPEAYFTPKLVTVDPQGRILVSGSGAYCPPCGKDEFRKNQVDVARLLPDGSLDASFGEDGVVGTSTSLGLEGESSGEQIAQPGLGATAEGGVVFGAGQDLIRLEPDGSPDPGYGKGGIAPRPAGTRALVVEPDGSVATVTSDSERGQTVSKLTPTGAPDPSFGTAGVLSLSPRIESTVEVIARSPGGGYVIGGQEAAAAGCRECTATPFLERVTASGLPDPSYGKNGIAVLDLPVARVPEPFTQGALVVGPEGSGVVFGKDHDSDALAIGLTASGAPDESFGKGGTLLEHHDQEVQLAPTGLALAPGGGLTLSTERFTAPGDSTGFQVAFGVDGKQHRRPGGAATVETLSHGTIASVGARGVAIWEGNEPKNAHALRSAAPNGLPIKEYGKNGRAKFPEGFVAEGITAAPGGGVLAFGVFERRTMAAFRIGPDGNPVRRFGDDGMVTLAFSHATSTAYAGLVEADGDVVITGQAGGHFVAARLRPDGRLDRGYGRGGRVRVHLHGSTAGGLIAASEGGVVIDALKVKEARYVSAGLLRLDSRGRLVRSFGRHGVVGAVAERQPLALFAGGGRIVVVNDPRFEKGHSGGGVELRSYKPDGSVDRAFGKRGVRFFGAGTDEEHVFTPAAAVQQAGGKVVVAGTARDGRQARAELLRFLLR
jgi:uncharacterized delta-60 repeat protein